MGTMASCYRQWLCGESLAHEMLLQYKMYMHIYLYYIYVICIYVEKVQSNLMKATYKHIHMMIYFRFTVFYILQRGYYFD